MALFREEAGSEFWSEVFVKSEGKVGLDGIGRSGSEQKHEAFRTGGIWGVGGRGRFLRTLTICIPKSVTHMTFHTFRN